MLYINETPRSDEALFSMKSSKTPHIVQSGRSGLALDTSEDDVESLVSEDLDRLALAEFYQVDRLRVPERRVGPGLRLVFLPGRQPRCRVLDQRVEALRHDVDVHLRLLAISGWTAAPCMNTSRLMTTQPTCVRRQ